MTRLKIQTLRRAGVLLEDVAALTGASARSVQRVAKEPSIEDPAGVDDAASQRMGRPSKVLAHEPQVQAWLAADPTMPTNHVLERLRSEGYAGSKTAVYDLVRQLRVRAPQRNVSRFEGLPGEFSQHDFGEVWVRYRDGSRERVKFFASVLKFSRMRRAMLVPDRRRKASAMGSSTRAATSRACR